jgi:hypothetical protein
MSFTCTEILRIFCCSLKDSKHTETIECFTFLLFIPAAKLATSKSIFCGKCLAQQDKIIAGGPNVNVLI